MAAYNPAEWYLADTTGTFKFYYMDSDCFYDKDSSDASNTTMMCRLADVFGLLE